MGYFLNPSLLYPYTGSTPRFVRLVSVVEVACGHSGNTSLAGTAGKVRPFLINYRQIVGYGPVNDRLLVTAQSRTVALGTYRTRSAVDVKCHRHICADFLQRCKDKVADKTGIL